ncbi:hypothetical protein CYY_000513 [Polysphondylium violaceum]|uniref:Myeloid-derived growth factor n=1 Tax=Polysphondylium violaceum TaxID=133409 RepID=A0A8J4V5K1_9MYCE|nr:hypothetical protein CYY_000513 [Polysphondylium violaceum]
MRSLDILLIAIVSLLSVVAVSASVDKEFDIKPLTTIQTVELKGDHGHCTFSYQASGGTNERWMMSLEENDDGTVYCAIGRPNPPSYLLFSHFSATLVPLSGKSKKKSFTANIMDNLGSILIKDQYDIKGNEVFKTNNFAGNLALLELHLN